MRVNDQLCQSQDFPTQMESVSETRLLSLFRGKGLHRFQVEVVIQMKIVEILSVDQQVEHVVTLSAYLKAGLHPV